MAAVKSYKVVATREARFWLLSVPELDVVTQAKTLDRAEATVRDLIAVWLDVAPGTFAVEIEPLLDDEWVRLLRETRQARSTAEVAQETASQTLRRAVSVLSTSGLSTREVGSLVGVSYQRVQQLLAQVGQRTNPK